MPTFSPCLRASVVQFPPPPYNGAMQFCSAISDLPDADDAVDAVLEEVRRQLRGEVTVAFLFFTADHVDLAETIADHVWRGLGEATLVGCSAEGVIGGDREIERAPGIAL